MVLMLHRTLKPEPTVLRKKDRRLIRTIRASLRSNMEEDDYDVNSRAARQWFIVYSYHGTHEQTRRVRKPLPDYRYGLLTYLQCFFANRGGPFPQARNVILFNWKRNSQRPTDIYTRLRNSRHWNCLQETRMGPLPIVYSYRNDHELVDMKLYMQHKGNMASRGSSSVSCSIVNLNKMGRSRKLLKKNLHEQNFKSLLPWSSFGISQWS